MKVKNTYADPEYGGAGYGRHERPIYPIQPSHRCLERRGASSDDPAIQRALILSRDLKTEGVYDILDVANKNPDGGTYASKWG